MAKIPQKSKKEKKTFTNNKYTVVEFVIKESMTSVFCKYITETDKAICVKHREKLIWVPYSLLVDDTPDSTIDYCFLIDEKIARQKEILW